MYKYRIQKTIAIIVVLIVCAVMAIQWYWSEKYSAIHTITLTDTGFEPKETIVKQGDSVEFVTNRGVPFWPASSFHPTHEIHPAFDSKKPVSSNGKWIFQFGDIGEWPFHDHIVAGYDGRIVVTADGQKSEIETDCNKIKTGPSRSSCWDKEIRKTIAEKGIEAGFNFLQELYTIEKDTQINCHEWVHILGEESYKLYKQTGDITIREESSWCSYGFFHGFINGVVWDTGSLTEVVSFCNKATEKFGNSMRQIKSNCFHGTGHAGVDLLFEKKEYWGEYSKTAYSGFETCDLVFGTDPDINECYGGVIHGLRFSMRNEQNGMSYGTSLDEKDPYFFCRNLNTRYQYACYADFSSMFWEIFNGNIQEATNYVLGEAIQDKNSIKRALRTMFTGWVERDLPTSNHMPSLVACRSVPTEYFDSCYMGILVGFIQHGEPKKLYEKAFAFCKSSDHSEAETAYCLDKFINLLTYEYSAEEIKVACDTLPIGQRPSQCNLSDS